MPQPTLPGRYNISYGPTTLSLYEGIQNLPQKKLNVKEKRALLHRTVGSLSDYSHPLEYGYYAGESRDFVFARNTNAWPLLLLDA